MKLPPIIIFLIVFMTVSLGVPFVLAVILPIGYALLGSFGISLVSGLILFWLFGKLGKQAQP